jgi:hypothetical protein
MCDYLTILGDKNNNIESSDILKRLAFNIFDLNADE